MSYLIVKERSAGDATHPNYGWWHFYRWPSMEHVKAVAHTNNNYSNDSGQSTTFGDYIIQGNCVCVQGEYTLYAWRREQILRQQNDAELDSPVWSRQMKTSNNKILRILGVSRWGNGIIVSGFEEGGTESGLYFIPAPFEDQNTNAPVKLTEFPDEGGGDYHFLAGIAIRGNILYGVSQDDNYLSVYRIGGTFPVGAVLMQRIELTTNGKYRGICFAGNTLIAGLELVDAANANKVEQWQLRFDGADTTAILMNEWDVSGEMHDVDNLMPYGLWAWNDGDEL